MATAGKALAAVGAGADLKKMQRDMAAFSRENAKMEMAGEMVDGALEDALDGDGVEEETDEMVNQVRCGGLLGRVCLMLKLSAQLRPPWPHGHGSCTAFCRSFDCLHACLPSHPSPPPTPLPTCVQVLDQIGIDLVAGSVAAPKQRVPASRVAAPAAAAETQEDEEADDLVARLAALK